MTKILHLITNLDTGGAQMMLYKLVARMDRTRFANVVVSMAGIGTLGRRIEALDIPVFDLNLRPGIPDPMGLWRLLRLLRKERPRVLQTWLYHADLLGLLAGKLAGVPALVWNLRCSELRKEDHSRILFWVLRTLAKLSRVPSAVIANSSAGRTAHANLGYKPVRWELIPNGFDVDIFRPSPEARVMLRQSLDLPEQTLLIGLVARFDPMKDHTTFLNAAGRLRGARPDVHFVLVGQGVHEKNTWLMRQVTALGLNDHVHLLGEQDDIPAITAAFDIASCSSYGEAFPNVIGEAMACGVPCVVTDVGDSAYIVGGAGIVVPRRDPSAMANAWADLLARSEDSRRALALAARERIVSLFSLDNVTRRYEKLYCEVAKSA